MESFLLKEEVETSKLVNREFQVQNSEKFEFPCVDLNFEKIKQTLNEILILNQSK